MVTREFVNVAKKKNNNSDATPAARARRRAPAKKTAKAVSASSAGNATPEPTRAEIAEAAYFRHLRRGGTQGDEFSDWVEAERELRRRSR